MPDENAPAEIIKHLSFRAAKSRYHISYPTWREIKDGKLSAWHPYQGGRSLEADVKEILDSVRSDPATATRSRAKSLGIRSETVQRVLKSKGLSRLVARLKYGGYALDVIQPLARARQHRVLACGPGVYTNIDFKRLGALRRLEPGDRSPSSQQFCGLQCVDAYSGFASVYVCEKEDTAAAAAGFARYVESATFKVAGLVLSDNGLPFLSDAFICYCATHNFVHRTTRYHHPWSNGKVESFNRTLKYSAMPALVAAGCAGTAQVQGWLDKWLVWYNSKRIHQGWINKGLPPQTVVDLWNARGGDVFAKLVELGHIKQDEVHRTRMMGSGQHAVDLGLSNKTPYALIIESPEPETRPPAAMGWTLPK
jgi:transposase InsO family protein